MPPLDQPVGDARLCPGCQERALPDHRDLCLFCLAAQDDGTPWGGSAAGKGQDWESPAARREREGA